MDEPAHLVSSRLYWQGSDLLRPGDMPPLIKMVSGWVPLFFDLPLPPNLGEPGESRHEWEVSLAMMERLPWDVIQPLFFYTRLPAIVFPLLTTVLIWWWARSLLSPAMGLLAAVLFVFEPTALAHGAIFKNDHAATFSYLFLWFCLWRYWRSGTFPAAALAGVAVAFCVLSKLTLLFAAGLAPLIILASGLARRRSRARTLTAAVLAVAVAYGLTLAAVQFQVHRLTSLELWRIDSNPGIPAVAAAAARIFTLIPVPDRIFEGILALVSGSAARMPVYLFGAVQPQGHPLYFLAALLVKAPVALLALGFAAIPLVIARAFRRRCRWTDLLWLLPGPLYIILASRVPYQLGIRLILPALPFGILAAVYAAGWLRRSRAGTAALFLLLALFVFETARIYPFGMAFFNIAAGGPTQGSRYLADSNLDWGQGLGELRRWAQKNNALPLQLSYFGADMIYRHFSGSEVELIPPPWGDDLARGVTRFRPRPDVYYAISPTLLPGHFFAPRYHDFYAAFRSLEPIARPGYSIYVYRLNSPP